MSQKTRTQQSQQNDARNRQPVHKDLDLYLEAVNPSLTDEFLNENNLGLGNLTEAEVYQQIESYRAGMFAEAAMDDLVEQRRINETKRELALHGCTYTETNDAGQTVATYSYEGWETDDSDGLDSELDGDDRDDRRRYLEAKSDLIWSQLPDSVRWKAIADHAGLPSWAPPHYRMLLARNEASKSKGARTQDNLFGRVKKRIGVDGNGSGKQSARDKLKNLAGNGRGGGL